MTGPEDTTTMTEHAPATPAGAPREGALLSGVRFLALLYVTLLVLVTLAIILSGLTVGWRPYVVTSGSMVPAIHPGDLVIVEPKAPGQAFDPPTILTFTDADRGLVTHRIVKAERVDNGEVRYTTKGDANRDPESGTIGQAEIVGSVRYVLRAVGLPIRWAQTANWGPLSLWAGASLLAVWLAVGLLRPKTPEEGA